MAKLTSSDCMTALRRKYPATQYALLEQVAPGTGWAASGWADAVALSLWPSRGLTLSGFEIKVSRGDWKRELEMPQKNAKVQAYCDHWWIVAPAKLIEPHELPETWGLLEVAEKGSARVKKAAPKLQAVPIDRKFFAAMLRRVAETQDARVSHARAEGREEGAVNGAGELAYRLAATESREQQLRTHLREFEEASGISIERGWNFGNIGETVRMLTSRAHRLDVADQLTRAVESHERLAAAAREELERLRAVPCLEEKAATEGPVYRLCSCTGACKGAAGLGEGWLCALQLPGGKESK